MEVATLAAKKNTTGEGSDKKRSKRYAYSIITQTTQRCRKDGKIASGGEKRCCELEWTHPV